MSDDIQLAEKITVNDTFEDIIIKLSMGNPGAVTVCASVVNKVGLDGFITLCHLDDMKIRGSNIWICYKEYCNFDIDKFIDLIKKQDHEMKNFVYNHPGFQQYNFELGRS